MNTCDFSKDCSKIPIPGKCVKFCLERILRNATVEEKQLILGLNKNLSDAIYNAYNGPYDINSFEDLERQLEPQQVENLLESFNKINQYQLNYFLRDRRERETIINAIRNMRLDLDNDFLFSRGF